MITVYTAIFDESDELLPVWGHGEFVAFTDSPEIQADGWDVRVVRRQWQDATFDLAWYKTHPHRLFPQSRETIWLDGGVLLYIEPEDLLEGWLWDEFDVGTLEHPMRYCAYDEAKDIARLNEDERDSVSEQMFEYWQAGLPRDFGLTLPLAVAYRNKQVVRFFSELWWSQMFRYPLREELSFAYAAWKCNLSYRAVPMSVGFSHPWLRFARGKAILH